MNLLKIPKTLATFGEALRWAREERGLSLRALGERLSCSAAYLVDLEHDRRNPNKVEEIARILRVELSDLQERAGCTPVLRDWLSRHPKLIRVLHDIRTGRGKPRLMKALGLK